MNGWQSAALAGLVLAGAVFIGACSSSSSPQQLAAGSDCASSPGACTSGTTCWPADSTPTLKCLTSQPGNGFGAHCLESIGQATCADGLACDQTGPATGSCTYYCGASGRLCPTGYTCRETHVGSPTGPAIDICRPGALDLDGGVFVDDGALGDGPIYDDALFQPVDGGGDGSPAMM